MKGRFGRLLFYAAISTCFFLGDAEAQYCQRWSTYSCDEPSAGAPPVAPERIRLGFVSPKDEIEPDVRKLYRVDVKCNSTQILPAARQGIFSRTDLVTTHFIAITGKALTGDALPTEAKALIPVYLVSTANANQSNFTNKACNTSFFISGREPLFIAATANQTENTTPGVLTNLFFAGLKVVNPVWPLFAGSAAAAALGPAMTGVAATEDPLRKLFASFDSKGTQTYSAPIYLGETNIRTPYSRTTVTVKEVPSIIKTDNGKFIVSFEKSLKGYSDEVHAPALDVATVAADCRGYAGQLVSENFPADDVAYGLSYVTQTAGLEKPKAVACLGKQYGLLSVKSFTCPDPGTGLACLWNRFKNDPLTADDFKDPYPIQKYQPAFFKRLRNAMADYAAASPNVGDATRAELVKYFQDEIEFEDLDRVTKGKEGKIASADFMQQLVESDFTKFGCEGKDSQAAGLLFGFPSAPGPDGLYQGDKLVGLRNWVDESQKVFKVQAIFQPGLAESAAKPSLMWCGKGLHLSETPKPDETQKPAGGAGQ